MTGFYILVFVGFFFFFLFFFVWGAGDLATFYKVGNAMIRYLLFLELRLGLLNHQSKASDRSDCTLCGLLGSSSVSPSSWAFDASPSSSDMDFCTGDCSGLVCGC